MSEEVRIEDALEAIEFARDPKWRARLRRSWWYQGEISHLLRPHGQLWIDRFIEKRHRESPSTSPFVVETHRRLGKSHYVLLRAFRRCLKKPGQRFIYALPTLEMASHVVETNMARVTRSCPMDLRPHKTKNRYIFKNPVWGPGAEPSLLDIVGVNSNPDSARGGGVDEAWVDEAGYCDELNYFVLDVLGFQFIGRDNPLLGMVSTPPKSMAHLFITKYVPEAKAQGRYMGIKGSKNPDYTEADKRVVISLFGDENSIAYRREAEIEHIADESRLVIPEWIHARGNLYREFEPPGFYFPMVAMDLGYWPDYTHILFGGVNFEDQRLMVLDEVQIRKETPRQLELRVREKEASLWGHDKFHHSQRLRRVADGTHLELSAFRDVGLTFEPVQRYDADAAIATLRRMIQEGKIYIHKRCEQLDYQLSNVIWNDKRKDWVRDEAVGHGDGIKALAYFARHADFRRNPYPPAPRVKDHFYRGDWERPRGGPSHPLIEVFR